MPDNNFFVIEPKQMSASERLLIKVANKTFSLLKINHRMKPSLNPVVDMNTIEQRINYYHLLSSVIENNVEGDVVELGTFVGRCAMLFQRILDEHGSKKRLHVYDSFEKTFTIPGSVEKELVDNFNKAGLKQPVIHKGLFNETLPSQLPQKIAFMHIDCGWGGDPAEHRDILINCLENTYSRLSPGAVTVLMDYHDITLNEKAPVHNGGVKLATDIFLKDKPEKMVALFGGDASHGYFKKL